MTVIDRHQSIADLPRLRAAAGVDRIDRRQLDGHDRAVDHGNNLHRIASARRDGGVRVLGEHRLVELQSDRCRRRREHAAIRWRAGSRTLCAEAGDAGRHNASRQVNATTIAAPARRVRDCLAIACAGRPSTILEPITCSPAPAARGSVQCDSDFAIQTVRFRLCDSDCAIQTARFRLRDSGLCDSDCAIQTVRFRLCDSDAPFPESTVPDRLPDQHEDRRPATSSRRSRSPCGSVDPGTDPTCPDTCHRPVIPGFTSIRRSTKLSIDAPSPGDQRPRADDTHLADQHVQQLRELIEAWVRRMNLPIGVIRGSSAALKNTDSVVPVSCRTLSTCRFAPGSSSGTSERGNGDREGRRVRDERIPGRRRAI